MVGKSNLNYRWVSNLNNAISVAGRRCLNCTYKHSSWQILRQNTLIQTADTHISAILFRLIVPPRARDNICLCRWHWLISASLPTQMEFVIRGNPTQSRMPLRTRTRISFVCAWVHKCARYTGQPEHTQRFAADGARKNNNKNQMINWNLSGSPIRRPRECMHCTAIAYPSPICIGRFWKYAIPTIRVVRPVDKKKHDEWRQIIATWCRYQPQMRRPN